MDAVARVQSVRPGCRGHAKGGVEAGDSGSIGLSRTKGRRRGQGMSTPGFCGADFHVNAKVTPVQVWVAFRSYRSRPLALLASRPTTEVLGRNEGGLELSALARWPTAEILGGMRGRPDLSASGTPSPNPCQGPLPLDPAYVFSWSTGVAPRYPPDSAVPTPE